MRLVGRLIVLVLTHIVLRPRRPGADRAPADRTARHPQLVAARLPPAAPAGYFVQPASAREAIEDLELLASPIKAFINDRCEVGPGRSVPVELLYQTWQAWCATVGRKDAGTKQTFGRDLKAAIPSLRTAQSRDGEARHRSYEGIGLKGKPGHDNRTPAAAKAEVHRLRLPKNDMGGAAPAYGRAIKHGFTPEQAKTLMPRCQKCLTQVLGDRRRHHA